MCEVIAIKIIRSTKPYFCQKNDLLYCQNKRHKTEPSTFLQMFRNNK